jgi:hypothetical protein
LPRIGRSCWPGSGGQFGTRRSWAGNDQRPSLRSTSAQVAIISRRLLSGTSSQAVWDSGFVS